MSKTESDKTTPPSHISIIMDGNRRWAKKRGLPGPEGHRQGSKTLETLMNHSKKIGIKCLSAWAWSTENWKRSKEETDFLFNLVRKEMQKWKKKFIKDKTHFYHIGRKDRLPEDIRKVLEETEAATKDFDEFTVALAVDYGGHDETIRAIKKLKDQNLEVTPENYENNLDTAGLPKMDLIIRTGGEKRLSGYMPWQSEYSELYFSDILFPDFNPKKLDEAIADFSKRDRRFGGDSTKK
jgi:undecaprenyl diphosphate synthase